LSNTREYFDDEPLALVLGAAEPAAWGSLDSVISLLA
jgi:hypothetical protein